VQKKYGRFSSETNLEIKMSDKIICRDNTNMYLNTVKDEAVPVVTSPLHRRSSHTSRPDRFILGDSGAPFEYVNELTPEQTYTFLGKKCITTSSIGMKLKKNSSNVQPIAWLRRRLNYPSLALYILFVNLYIPETTGET